MDTETEGEIKTELMLWQGYWLKNGVTKGCCIDAVKNVKSNFEDYGNDGFSKDFGVNREDVEIAKGEVPNKGHKRYRIFTKEPIPMRLNGIQGTYKGYTHLCVEPHKFKVLSSYHTEPDYSVVNESSKVDKSIDLIRKRTQHCNELIYKKVVKQENVAETIVNKMKGLEKHHCGILIGLSDPNLNEILDGLVDKEKPIDLYKENRAAFEGLYHFLGYDNGIERDYIFEDKINGKGVKCIMTKSRPKNNLTVGRIIVDRKLTAELGNLIGDWMNKT